MDDQAAFRKFLKQKGKKEHVVDGLVSQVLEFEHYLAQERGKTLESANFADLLAYVELLDAQVPGSARKKVRGLGLYYQHSGNSSLAAQANQMRSQRIAKQRKPFLLRDFRGADPQDIQKLKDSGLVDVEQMRQAGKTPQARQWLAEKTGVAPEAILELVKLSDLARIQGLKGIRARLYYDAGAQTPQIIAQWEPENLRQMLTEFVERTGFEGIPPLPKEVQSCVNTARKLPQIVQY